MDCKRDGSRKAYPEELCRNLGRYFLVVAPHSCACVVGSAWIVRVHHWEPLAAAVPSIDGPDGKTARREARVSTDV